MSDKVVLVCDPGGLDAQTQEHLLRAGEHVYGEDNVRVEDGEIVDCEKCEHLSCVCDIKASHAENCPWRIAATCAIGIACDDHGRDTCPVCDACNCKEGP